MSFRPSEFYRHAAVEIVDEIATLVHSQFPDADVQDMGATAIPGLLTKGDVDVNVRVAHDDLQPLLDLLRQHLRVHQSENWTDGYASFADDDGHSLPVGVQVTVRGHADDKFLIQRDRLAGAPRLIAQYNELKRRLEGATMTEYRQAKWEFIAQHLDPG